MAARPLATEGIVVLQVLGNSEHVGMAREANDNVRGYASAIERLSTEGIVDPNRVGIVGFSRTCWYVESALLDLPSAFAAASINDGIDHSYMQTMLFDLDRTSEGEEIYGAKPFGRGLKEWVNQAPTFHLDKVQAPVIITAITPGSVLQEWEIYSSLYRQKKPVDFLYFPKGQHILQRPSNRLASQQGTVDWFLFWLEGREDRNDPAKQDEYDRWVHLRELQKAGATASADPSHPSEEH
jgi:dipeptidyl aminopeptidase/acylaminoacyl peptidase